MRKSMYLIGLVAVALMGVGCSKSKGNGTVQAYSPNSCFNNVNGVNNGYLNNGFNNGYLNNANYNGNYTNNNSGINNGINQRYQPQNGHCLDTARGGVEVSYSLCNNVSYSNNASCTNYGYGNGYYNGNVQGAYNACSIYNTPVEQFYPVYYANLGVTVCAGYSAINTLYAYGQPAFYGGYNNIFQGCIPGVPSRCNCNSFGGRLGWFSAGIQLGVCY